MFSTYSFLDSVLIVTHPLIAIPISIVGEGAGNINIAYSEDKTAMEAAADGSVMVTKQATNIGTISITVQQTSRVHKELLRLFNQLYIADPSNWAVMAVTMKNITDGTGHLCTGVAFQKIADKGYAKVGGNVVWNLMAADIQSLTV